MSGYYIGLVLGSVSVPKYVGRVGHIRMFGALASLASAVILIHIIIIDPWVWWVLRVVTGFAYAGLYVVAESWLNDASENETRAQLLSFYMVIQLIGLAGGQLLLNMAPPSGFELFVLISVLVGFAVVPILVTVSRAPDFETVVSVSIAQLFQVSPLGVIGMLVSSVSIGVILGLGAVYGSKIGMTVQEISFFMGAIIVGGAVVQLPLGRISDRYGRRLAILGVCLGGVLVSLLAIKSEMSGWKLYAFAAALGAMSTPLYSLCAAHTNDYLTPPQMVAASGTLVLISGVGATLGLPITAFAMEFYGTAAFYYCIAISLGFLAGYGVWRSTRRDALAQEDLGDFVVLAPTPMSVSFNPDVDLEGIEAASGVNALEVQASFEELAAELQDQDNDDIS
jgi:MFS family permease